MLRFYFQNKVSKILKTKDEDSRFIDDPAPDLHGSETPRRSVATLDIASPSVLVDLNSSAFLPRYTLHRGGVLIDRVALLHTALLWNDHSCHPP